MKNRADQPLQKTRADRCAGKPEKAGVISLPILPGAAAPEGRVRRSAMSIRRAAVLILLNVLMVLHVVQWSRMGKTVSPIEPSETMYTLRDGKLNAGFIFFSLALLSTLVLGRWVCGWGCHIVSLQDFCGWFMKKCGVRPRAFRSRTLVFVPLLAGLYMFAWPVVARFVDPPDGRIMPRMTNHLVTTEFWTTFPSVWVAVPFLLVCGFGAVYFLGAKGYCTYACPYGGFFGVLDRLAPARIRVTDDCNQCGHCTVVCTSNVQVHQEVRDFGKVVDPGCMKCMDCVSVCPNDALYFGFARTATVGTAQNEVRPQAAKSAATSKPKSPPYDLTPIEDVLALMIFGCAFFATRGVYGLVPFLFALGWAGIVTFSLFKVKRMVTERDVYFHRALLKSQGRHRPGGIAFWLVALAMTALTLHSGIIRLAEWRGTRLFERVGVAEDAVLFSANDAAWATPDVRAAGVAGGELYAFCDKWGLIRSPETQRKLAWFSLLRGDRPAAVGHLEEALRRQQSRGPLWHPSRSDQLQPLAQIAYYLGVLQASINSTTAAHAALELAITTKPDFLPARQFLGALWAREGRMPEAMEQWSAILTLDPHNAPALHNLAGASRELRRMDDAVMYYKRALDAAPNDADTHFELGRTYSMLGRQDLASPHLQRALQLDPRYREAIEGPP